jgi:glycosyltransferase involved in cell wall biosynthesis
MPPKFSIVIPAYNQARFLTETIQSLLDQTFSDFEIIVVNDASTDDTNAVIAQLDDPRLRCIEHPQNKGLPAARNTGMNASNGEYIALLDADDVFHPRKLEEHARFLSTHPEISVTYNPRYELHHSSRLVREIYRPPLQVGLRDFILGFPFSPSDMVIRREASAQINHFDAYYVCGGEDMDYPCRLALAGNQFASVDKVLNYRRFHAGRPRKKLRCRISDYTKALELVLIDPRCPKEFHPLIQNGLANHYSEVAWTALAQGEIELGVEILAEIAHLDPTMVSGAPSRLTDLFFVRSLKDYTQDHQELLQRVFACLPAELALPPEQLEGYIARGFLIKGSLALLWGQNEAGQKYFAEAARRHALIDRQFVDWLTSHIINYQDDTGSAAGYEAINRLAPFLSQLGGKSNVRSLRTTISLNRAFSAFREQNYSTALKEVRNAVTANPAILLNRGVISISLRSLLHPNG